MSADRAAGDRAEIGSSFWTALERPDVDEIVVDCFDVIYPLAELRGDPGAEADSPPLSWSDSLPA